MKNTLNLIIGIVIAILSCGILIYAYETDRSFIQIIIAFLILFLPIAFISGINNKVAVFLIASFLILGTYICIKHQWYDTIFGVILSIILGGSVYYFRVSKAKTFDSAEYKKNQKENRHEK